MPDIVTCWNCQVSVVRKPDGTCPSCGVPADRPPAAQTNPFADAAAPGHQPNLWDQTEDVRSPPRSGLDTAEAIVAAEVTSNARNNSTLGLGYLFDDLPDEKRPHTIVAGRPMEPDSELLRRVQMKLQIVTATSLLGALASLRTVGMLGVSLVDVASTACTFLIGVFFAGSSWVAGTHILRMAEEHEPLGRTTVAFFQRINQLLIVYLVILGFVWCVMFFSSVASLEAEAKVRRENWRNGQPFGR